MGPHERDDREFAAVSPMSTDRSLRVYIGVNCFVIFLQLLGGFGGLKFAGNIFLGISILLGLVVLSLMTMVDNKTYAKSRPLGWYTFFPLFVGFLSLGFSWYFSWLLWWGMFFAVVCKKTLGDQENANAAKFDERFRNSSGDESVPIDPLFNEEIH